MIYTDTLQTVVMTIGAFILCVMSKSVDFLSFFLSLFLSFFLKLEQVVEYPGLE